MEKFNVPISKGNIYDNVDLYQSCVPQMADINLFQPNFFFHLLHEIIRFYYSIDELFWATAYLQYYTHIYQTNKSNYYFANYVLFSIITWQTHTDRVSRNLIGSKPVCKSPYSPGCPAPMFAESVYRLNTTNKLKQCGSRKALQRVYIV